MKPKSRTQGLSSRSGAVTFDESLQARRRGVVVERFWSNLRRSTDDARGQRVPRGIITTDWKDQSRYSFGDEL